MGIFKDLFRDIAERNLSDRQICIRRGREAEAQNDLLGAVHWYEQAQEWEKAGDACVAISRGKVSADDARYKLKNAAAHYLRGRCFAKVREAYTHYFLLYSWFGLNKDDVQCLKQAGELPTFVADILWLFPGPDLPSEKEWRAFANFLDALFEIQEYWDAAEVFLRFWKALAVKRKIVLLGLLEKGDIAKAREIGCFLAKGKALHRHEYPEVAKMFIDKKAYKAAEEMFCIEFTSEPRDAVLDGIGVLGGLSEWKSFLSYALNENPLKLAEALRNLSPISSPEDHPGGEIEADFLLKCYEAVGPQSLENNKEGTIWWLYSLTEFWKARGDKAREAELRYRCAEDKKRLGIVHLFSGYDYAWAAWAFADKQEFDRAAEAMEKAALTDHSLPRNDPNFGFWYQGAKLYEKVGNREKAAELYDQCGQSAKASSLRGTILHDANEAGTVVEALNVPRDSKDWILKKVEELASGHAAEDAAGALLQELEREKGGMWEDWLVVPVLYKRSKDNGAYTETLRKIELKFRNRGRWVFAAKIYLFEELYDEFDRVCIEEDELEVAALWYEQAKMPERAAKIYDLMGQSGKSGKAQSEGAKQKPQDTARSKSESAEEPKEGTLDQLVCPQCAAEVKPHWTACPKCDADLQQRKCKNCGEPLELDWKRCPACRATVTNSS